MKKNNSWKASKKDRKHRRDDKLRRMIALDAAKMMYNRSESEYFTAKRKAARKMGVDFRYHPSDLPSNFEIREQILNIANLYEGEKRFENLKSMRFYAFSLMKKLASFHPKLIGSTLTGHIRKGSDIDIHIFSDSISPVTQVLENHGYQYHIERKRIVKYNEERVFTHIHIHGRFEAELTVYASNLVHYRFKSSITGKAIENASLKQLEELFSREYPDCKIEKELERYESEMECYEFFKLLLLPLEDVKESVEYHPEGDALYHSLQVFELAIREGYGYDIEFLQAALLHDIGKSIDYQHHAVVGAEVLEGFVSERVLFLIRHHIDALYLQQKKLGHKKQVVIKQSPYFEDLLALRDLDSRGRKQGVLVSTIDEALDYLKRLENGEIGL